MFFFKESIRIAFDALKQNTLRSILSLLGVTVGVFIVVSVLTIVEALDASIRKSLSFLGSDVLYVGKFPWKFDRNLPWWKYLGRPNPTLEELDFLENKLRSASAISLYAVQAGQTARYQNNSVSNLSVQGVTFKQNVVAYLPIVQGRYFTFTEIAGGYAVAILGANIVTELFGNQYPIGKVFKIKEVPFKVIGVFERQGENLLNFPSNDDICMIPYQLFTKIFASQQVASTVLVAKGYDNDNNLETLESEIRTLLRAKRGIKPLQEDNFSINRPEMIAEIIQNIITILTIAGWFIGGFSLLVGCFGIANIMFVSVKERTHIIGIQKALGAKNSFILLQFLLEAIFLSLAGGILGIVPVLGISWFSTEAFLISLSWKKIVLGNVIATCIGIIAGIAPAYQASRLHPVEAIRTGI
ncbi:MAG: ABC transporter permease [Cytophagales bacterium]|nr:ABC transporter permease [Cytophagales bacterium]MDW8383342.1 ABC transporter permease [Flammeovirgaceae bacterium]